MTEPLSRRDALKVLGAASASAVLPGSLPAAAGSSTPTASSADILPLTSTSDVFIPPRGRGYDKFSFDFPEPSVEVDGLRLGAMVFTRENAYGLDRDRMTVERIGTGRRIVATGLVWAGGQERAPGKVSIDVVQAK